MIKKLFNMLRTITPEEASAQLRHDREVVLHSMRTGVLEVDPASVIKVYIEKKPWSLSRRIVALTDECNSRHGYTKKDIDAFDGWIDRLEKNLELDVFGLDRTGFGFSNGLEAKLKRAIRALGFVELELPTGEIIGINPRKYAISEMAAKPVNYTPYSFIEEEASGFSIKVKGSPFNLQDSFQKGLMTMATAEEKEEQERREHQSRVPAHHVNPFLKASAPERQPR
jgi:hypothetical protein